MSEKQIENLILSYLALRKVFAFKVERTGIYDPTKGVFRRKMNVHNKKGVSDLIGIYRQKPLAIEIKSKKGRISPDQNMFLLEWRAEGGFGFIARSVEDVMAGLKAIDEILDKKTGRPESLPANP